MCVWNLHMKKHRTRLARLDLFFVIHEKVKYQNRYSWALVPNSRYKYQFKCERYPTLHGIFIHMFLFYFEKWKILQKYFSMIKVPDKKVRRILMKIWLYLTRLTSAKVITAYNQTGMFPWAQTCCLISLITLGYWWNCINAGSSYQSCPDTAASLQQWLKWNSNLHSPLDLCAIFNLFDPRYDLKSCTSAERGPAGRGCCDSRVSQDK